MFPAGVAGVTVRQLRLPNGIHLRVAQRGPTDGHPVVLLHGWGASLYTWRFLLDDLASAGFHALAPDLRGHGLSDKPVGRGQYTRDALTGDVRALLDMLGLARVSVVGHSMGGAIATQLALAEPGRVARLVVVNPAGFTRIPLVGPLALFSPRLLDRLSRYVSPPRWVIRRILRWTYGDSDRATDRDVDEYWAPSQFRDYLRATRALLREFHWTPAPATELARLTVPTLVIVGTADRLVTGVGAVARRLSCARVVELAGAGHLACEERADEVNGAILAFLSGDPET